MIIIPHDTNSIITLMGLDPGSTNLGVAILKIDVTTMLVVSSQAWTINGAQLMNKTSWMQETYGDRFYRINLIENRLIEDMRLHDPVAIASESPFINSRFPAAGIALTEVLCAIKNAVMIYDKWKQVHLIPPSSGKNAIGAKGNAKKEDMTRAMLALPEIANTCINNLNHLDEHSIDALAIAYGLLNMYRNPIK